jgi:hypothetical protein
MHSIKIPISTIEQIGRGFEHAPQRDIEAVPKGQAIRMLTGPIKAMLSKGYDWAEIARLLSEQGLSVSPVTLRSYVQHANVAVGKKKSLKRKGLRGAQGIPARASHGAVDGVGTKEVPGPRPGANKVMPAIMPRAAALEVATESAKGVRRPSDGGATRRSAFVPTEDSDEI